MVFNVMRMGGLLLAASLFGQAALAQEPLDAAAVVQRAANAHGGSTALQKLRVAQVTYAAQGDAFFLPALLLPLGAKGKVDLRVEETYELPGRIKKVVQGKINGKDLHVSWAADGSKLWYRDADGRIWESDDGPAAGAFFRPHQFFERLAGLNDLEATELFENNKPGAIGIWTAHAKTGSAAVLFIDKTSQLLAGARAIAPNPLPYGVDAAYGDYQDMAGLKLPGEMSFYHRGEKIGQIKITGARFQGNVGGKAFAAPMGKAPVFPETPMRLTISEEPVPGTTYFVAELKRGSGRTETLVRAKVTRDVNTRTGESYTQGSFNVIYQALADKAFDGSLSTVDDLLRAIQETPLKTLELPHQEQGPAKTRSYWILPTS